MNGPTLKQLRQDSKKTCAEVAQALGVTLRAVFNYEYGIRQIGLKQVLILAELYDCTAEEIIIAALNSCR